MKKMNENASIQSFIKFHLELLNHKKPSSISNNELEVRFGTKDTSQQLTRIDYINVVTKLNSLHYISYGPGIETLKIYHETKDDATGYRTVSNIRTEIKEIDNIKTYFKTNSIKDLDPTCISMMTKSLVKNKHGEPIHPLDVNPFNFRVSYQNETILTDPNIISEIDNQKKMYRLLNRISFFHPTFPFRIDLSTVRSSLVDSKNRPIYTYRMDESNVMYNRETFEIEIEMMNEKIMGNESVEKLALELKTCITHVLSGIQESNFPITYDEQRSVNSEYLTLVNDGKQMDRIGTSKDFCGPSSVTLQMKNIQPFSKNELIPNIRNFYTVTEKADGQRKLLYINAQGKLYLITIGLVIQYTGIQLPQKNHILFNSLIDGEHILHDKKGHFINEYAAFDIYFIHGKTVRAKSFIHPKGEGRLSLLQHFIEDMPDIHKERKDFAFHIKCKSFLIDTSGSTIFHLCKDIWNRVQKNEFDYEIDGLIFTPMLYAVGGKCKDIPGSILKTMWEHSFKWKPSKYNTIDFLVTTKKNEYKKDVILDDIEMDPFGIDMTLPNKQMAKYKVIELRVGFDPKFHGFLNPFEDVLHDVIPEKETTTKKYNHPNNSYKPVLFYPTSPYDPNTHLCHIKLSYDNEGELQMKTEEGDVFFDKMIVEFRYDFSKEMSCRWIPVRVRHDKTIELRKNNKEYGNAYHVANNNWNSIHYPITEEMLSTGINYEVDTNMDDGVYYNRQEKKTIGENTTALRDFHNRFIKKKLISIVSSTSSSSSGDKKELTLMDFTVGKGGDLQKWIDANISFVFGIDLSRDNIENKLDGACARYLNRRRDSSNFNTRAIFVTGNSARNIKNGEAFETEKDKEVARAIFGMSSSSSSISIIGSGLSKQFGKGKDGFDITSCQFALHYFFKDQTTLKSFIQNVAESTKLHGYFIGTCYDGKRIFEWLKSKKENESEIIKKNHTNILELTKRYHQIEMKDDISCLGYSIDVYQESINKTFSEYLVNFDYFVAVMETFGFVLLTDEETKSIGLKNSIGTFEELYDEMILEVENNQSIYGQACFMDENEKNISFLNNYFVFRKLHDVE